MKSYCEYEIYKIKLCETQMRYNRILSEKENLFARTQPQGISFEEKYQGGNYVNAFDQYLIEKEKTKIDERLIEIKSLLDDRTQLLEMKEEEIRASKDPETMIYCLRYLDKLKIYKIQKIVHYSEAQIYRYLNTIRENIKELYDDRK